MEFKPDKEDKIMETLSEMHAEYKIKIIMTARHFRFALLYGIILTIIWTVVGHFIPYGNWTLAFNIIMILLSIWIMAPASINFFSIRMDWRWLAIILSAIVYLGVIIGLRSLILNLFY